MPVVREIDAKRGAAAMLYNPDLTDPAMCAKAVMWAQAVPGGKITAEEIRKKYVFVAESRVSSDTAEAIDALLDGDAVLFFDEVEGYILLNVRKYDKRSVDEPPLSTVTYGPREGFIEDLKTNLCLLERRIRSPRLAIEKLKIGSVTKTDVAVAYINGIASRELVKRVMRRLESVEADGVMDVQYLQPYLEERPY